jgi:RNA polymerase sigma-70 factor (ECF subfamily)
VSELGDFDPPSEAPAGEEILARKDEARSVARALSKIPPEQMEILTLSFIEDLPQAEIARRLNLPLGTVKSRMRLAYGHLRKNLEQPA